MESPPVTSMVVAVGKFHKMYRAELLAPGRLAMFPKNEVPVTFTISGVSAVGALANLISDRLARSAADRVNTLVFPAVSVSTPREPAGMGSGSRSPVSGWVRTTLVGQAAIVVSSRGRA